METHSATEAKSTLLAAFAAVDTPVRDHWRTILARLRLLSWITAVLLALVGLVLLTVALLDQVSLVGPLLAMFGSAVLILVEALSQRRRRSRERSELSDLLPEHASGSSATVSKLSDRRAQPSLIENDEERRLHEDQLTEIEVGLRADPNSASLHRGRAVALTLFDRQHDALRAVDVAIRLDPHFAEAHCTRSHILLELRRYGEALDAADQALALKADDPCAEMNRSWALSALGRFDEALTAADQAIRLDDSQEEAYRVKAEALEGLGRRSDALRAVESALETRSTKRGKAQRDRLLRRLD